MSRDLKKEFLEPSGEYTAVPFWFWNAALDKDEIRRQIGEFQKKGVDGFVIHPRKGLSKGIPYLSDTYMEYVRTALEEAKRRGMRVVLYDEAMYPSGSAHGMVAEEDPRYASQCLTMEELDEEDDLTLIREADMVSVIAVRLTEKDGEFCPDLASARALRPENGIYHFEPPEGENWHLFCFRQCFSEGTIRGVYEEEDDRERFAPKSADLLNPEAVDAFIRLTYDRYYEAAGEYFGDTVIAVFTDEPNILGRCHRKNVIPWTTGFLDYYIAHGGREEDLPALWAAGSRPGSGRDPRRHPLIANVFPEMSYRYAGSDEALAAEASRRFRRIVCGRMKEVYYGRLSDWCAAHHVALTGHPETSQDIGMLERFQIPGQDLCLRMVDPASGTEGFDSVLAKCSSDAARHRGILRNSDECLGCCGPLGTPWAMTADDVKWYLDWLFVRGVNLLYLHAFYYSIEGETRYGERPPDVGPHNIWWGEFRLFADYIKRMSWLMSGSFNVTRLAVLCEADRLPWKIVKPLYERQLEFNYLEEDLILDGRCRAENGELIIQKQRYRYLLAEDESLLTDELMGKLAGFLAGGGQILRTGDMEDFIAAYEHDQGEGWFRPAAPGLRVSHVVKENADFYLLVNEGEETIEGVYSVPADIGGRNAEIWDPWRGTIRPAHAERAGERYEIPVRLPRRESLILCFGAGAAVNTDAWEVSGTAADAEAGDMPVTAINAKAEKMPGVAFDENAREMPGAASDGDAREMPAAALDTAAAVRTGRQTEAPRIDLTAGPWKVSMTGHRTDGRPAEGIPADAVSVPVDGAGDWRGWPGMGDFTGRLAYETEFTLGAAGGRIELDLGEVHELARVSVNGRDLGVRMWAPYVFAVTDCVREGTNHLRIEVANSLANHLEHANLASGLVGPVTIRTGQ